jgi:hypothetical protein
MSCTIDVVGSFGGLSRSLKWDHDVGSRALFEARLKASGFESSDSQQHKNISSNHMGKLRTICQFKLIAV